MRERPNPTPESRPGAAAPAIAAGTWVGTVNSGIWRVHRVLDAIGLDPSTGRETTRRTVFCSRFVNDAMQRSFTTACYDPAVVFPLGAESLASLDQFIAANEKLAAKFAAYVPKPIDCIHSARIATPEGMEPADVAARIPPHAPLRQAQIGPFVQSLGFEISTTRGWSVCFRSEDHHCIDGYLVHRFSHVHPF